jgi:hypothetical protein
MTHRPTPQTNRGPLVLVGLTLLGFALGCGGGDLQEAAQKASEVAQEAAKQAATLTDKDAVQKDLCKNVNGIRTAEIAYDAMYDGYLELPEWPQDPGAVTGKVPWGAAPEQWVTIAWTPDGSSQGVYQVKTTDTAFQVIGRAVAEGPVCCSATADESAAPTACTP